MIRRQGFALFVCFTSFLVNIIECKKPSGSRQQAIWRVECELAVITDPDCPVDGGWTPWSPWSECYGSCDDVGHRRRVRECNNPPPSQDGLPCTGPDIDIEPCYITNCTVTDFVNIVKGDPVRSEALRVLSAVPSIMEMCLQVDCSYEAIEEALKTENTWQILPENIWNSLLCVKHNLGCPENGQWGPWGAWSSCGSRCGHGLKWRLRRCDSPPPSMPNLLCTGTPLQADECEGDQCAVNKRDSAGTWGEWGNWSPCTENCGLGVRRRKRICNEISASKLFGSWGTHCRGQHDEMEVCENKECVLDGGWSGWGAWGPCSKTCGNGKRSRTRSCTRPVPAGNGTPCIGRNVDVNSCNLRPCDAFTHTVAIFNGESYLQYDFPNKHSILFHFYIRFLSLSPHGTLVRREIEQGSSVRLSLQKWHVCLDAGGLEKMCSLPRLCTHDALEPADWHTVMVTVTSEVATLRIDDSPTHITSRFPCDPDLPDTKLNIFVGERLHGEIQEVILNFKPLSLFQKRLPNQNIYPTKGTNVIYEKASLEESFLNLHSGNYLRMPCFDHYKDWTVSLTLKSKKETATILFSQDKATDTWLLLTLENSVLKLRTSAKYFRYQSVSTKEILPDQWIDISLSRKQDIHAFEVLLNEEDRLHFNFEALSVNESSFKICDDYSYIGGVPFEIKKHITEDFTPLFGVIASLRVNDELVNIHEVSIERWQDDILQISSRTASISGYYHETAWGWSNHLNLTCLHARSVKSSNNTAYWLHLDTTLNRIARKSSLDDGRILRLITLPNFVIKGFYTCRTHSNKGTSNIVTYGVVGKVPYKLASPDITTAIAVLTTLCLVILTLGWFYIEGLHDIKNGYGFYRDDHMGPEERAEAVCEFIDQHVDEIGSKSAAEAAKAKARRIGKYLASNNDVCFAAPSPASSNETSKVALRSSLEKLPALMDTEQSRSSETNYLITCAQSYVSSPRHGTISSPRTRYSSRSSTQGDEYPRVVCAKFRLSKRGNSPRAISSKLNKTRLPQKTSNLLTIKSSRYVSESVAMKVLDKFRELKKDDN